MQRQAATLEPCAGKVRCHPDGHPSPGHQRRRLCQRLRSWHHCPIIFTSCLDDTDTIVRALEMGGDDFLAKPYNNKILLARIMATSAGCRWTVQSPASTLPLRGLHAGCQQPQRGEGWPQRPSADMEYASSPSSSATRTPSSQPTSSTRRYGARKRLGDVRTVQVHIHNLRSKIEPDPASCILKKCLGQGLCVPAGRRQGLRIVLMRAPTS